MVVDIKAKEDLMYVFIYDIITTSIDDPKWVERSKNTVLLVIYTIFRTIHSSEPNVMTLYHFSNYQEKFDLPNTRNIWAWTSNLNIYGYLLPKKKRKPGYSKLGSRYP